MHNLDVGKTLAPLMQCSLCIHLYYTLCICAFVDLKKAFDSVYRNAHWYKLFNMGIDGKMLQIYRLYETVKSCVRHGNNTYSDFFRFR